MIPARFIFEYPQRCIQLIAAMEPVARSLNLIGSFSLLVAPSLFLVPYERMKKAHPLGEHEREPEIYIALRRVDRQKFVNAEFWRGSPRGSWRLTRIVTEANHTNGWEDIEGLHPFSQAAKNQIDGADAEKVIRVIRNALAHGNIVYLDENGYERQGAQVQHLAFLSRYEESELDRQKSETYRVVSVTEEEFLHFLQDWAAWLQAQGMDSRIVEAA